MSKYTSHREENAAANGGCPSVICLPSLQGAALAESPRGCPSSSRVCCTNSSSRSSSRSSSSSRRQIASSTEDAEEFTGGFMLHAADAQTGEALLDWQQIEAQEDAEVYRCLTKEDFHLRLLRLQEQSDEQQQQQQQNQQQQKKQQQQMVNKDIQEEEEEQQPLHSDTEAETCTGSPLDGVPSQHQQQQQQQQQQQDEEEEEAQQEQQQERLALLHRVGDRCCKLDDPGAVSVMPLFNVVSNTGASGGPSTPTCQSDRQQHQQDEEEEKQHEEEEEEEDEDGDIALRWECRVVTPCLGVGVDCFSAEGCGVVVCGSPYSFFDNCCNVEVPAPYIIRSSSSSSSSYLSPQLSAGKGSKGSAAAAAERSKAFARETHIEEDILLDSNSEGETDARTLQWSGRPIKLFVGTWNTEYQEFATEYLNSLEAQLQAKDPASKRTAMSIEWSEGSSTHTPMPGLHATESSASSLTMGLDTEAESHIESDSEESTLSEAPPLIQRQSTLGLGKPSKHQQPLRDWIKPGYDVYVVTLQEVTNDNIFGAIELYLEVEHGERFVRVKMGDGKISGLGKGAWTKMKATSMACWIRESMRSPNGPVTPLAYRAFSFTRINGSKGALTLVLKMYDQVVCFVGCHMPASGVKGRFRARQHIRQKLAQVYSYSSEVDFTRVFHHVIWAGDFNFRLQASPEVYMPLLEKQDMESLLQYDESREDFGQDMVLHQMREAPVRFLPTYKKADGRPPLNTEDPDWILKEYQTQMKKGVLGQRKMVERPPSWCDRVFFWSMPAVVANLQAIPGEYFAAEPKEPSVLMASDHSPVGCGLHLFALDGEAPPVFFEGSAEGAYAKSQLAS